MTAKVKDGKNRWRNKLISFRMSPEEAECLDRYVQLSGLSKQEYLINRVLCREVVVMPSPRIYNALKQGLAEVAKELQRIEQIGSEDDELLQYVNHMIQMIESIKGEQKNDK